MNSKDEPDVKPMALNLGRYQLAGLYSTAGSQSSRPSLQHNKTDTLASHAYNEYTDALISPPHEPMLPKNMSEMKSNTQDKPTYGSKLLQIGPLLKSQLANFSGGSRAEKDGGIRSHSIGKTQRQISIPLDVSGVVNKNVKLKSTLSTHRTTEQTSKVYLKDITLPKITQKSKTPLKI